MLGPRREPTCGRGYAWAAARPRWACWRRRRCGHDVGWRGGRRRRALHHVAVAFGKVDPAGELHYLRSGITFAIQTSNNGNTGRDQTFFSHGGYANTKVNPTTSLTTVQATTDVEIMGNPSVRYVRINVTDTKGQGLGILRLRVTPRP